MSQKVVEQTYYQILDLSPSAGHHDIVAAYQKAKLAYSPDSPALYTMFSKEEATELLKLIEEAFRILSNQNSRREYDNVLMSRTKHPTASDLPDFAPTPILHKNETPIKTKTPLDAERKIVNSQSSSNAQSIPDGFAKSKLSVYEVKESMEKEIATQTEMTGAFLQKVRLYKNINLDQLSRETRISRSYLAAIETDDYEALPAPVFLRGFLIQMARLLGLDETKTANSYLSRVKK